ncbi:MAG: thermostable hemolysin [Dokdonella sp.]
MIHPKLRRSAFEFHSPCTASAPSIGSQLATRIEKQRAPQRLIEHRGASRAPAEAFIANRFRQSFGAHIEAFMPRLFTMHDLENRISGAFGLRSTSCRLFVEQYLNEPIESAVATRCGEGVERHGIVEVGHLCAAFPGAVRTMIALLTLHLHAEGFEWVVFTGTASLRNAFARIGLFPIALQRAHIDSLPLEARMGWGNYYDHSPEVLVGRIRDGVGSVTGRNIRVGVGA